MVMAQVTGKDLSVIDEPLRNRCGAHGKRSGKPCQRYAMPNGRCQVHGGKTPRGIASPNYKHGRRCKDLPIRLQARAQESFDDPELLSQRMAVAILDARFWDVMASTSNQESGELWDNLHKAKQQYHKADGREAEEKRAAALADTWYLITEGYNERQSWREMRDILQEMRALKESERKRLIDMQQMMSATQANLLLGAVAHSVKQTMDAVKLAIAELPNVTREQAARITADALQSISSELGQLVHHGE